MRQLSCATVWGGIKNQDLDACSAVMDTSLYSSACDGGKGGDIYYISVCKGDMLTRIAIADVVGHGERVSRVSQWLYDVLQERMNGGGSDEVLTALNRIVNARGHEALTTAAIVGIHKPDSQASFAYAGHHPMLMKRRGAPRWQDLPVDATSAGVANLPLGVQPEMHYDQQSITVQPGDRVLLYTDGVVETPAPNGDRFGRQRLQTLLDNVGNESLYELKTAVLSTLRDFAGGELAHDDVTLLAIEVR